MGFGGPFGAVHGQFVVPKSGGGSRRSTPSAGRSHRREFATSITVKSADGFSKTYQVCLLHQRGRERNGISPVKTGHQVTVTATVSGSTDTAASILDLNLLPDMHGGGGWNHPTPSAPPTTGVGLSVWPRPGLGQGPGPGPDTTSAVAPPAGLSAFVGPVGENLIRAGRHRRRAE